ncbi:MAG: hypothetical protein RLZZ597_2312 [Cyanobacteriota bacterium]|jgi:heat shock protein HslJ
MKKMTLVTSCDGVEANQPPASGLSFANQPSSQKANPSHRPRFSPPRRRAVPVLAGNLIALSFLLLACQDSTGEVIMDPTSGVSSSLSSGLDPNSRADMTLNTPTPPAEGPSPNQNQPHWQLTHWVEDTQTITLAPEAEISLDWEQGQMSGYGGCNRFRATYRLEGDRVIVDSIESTRRACKGLIMEQETLFFTALSQVSQVTLANNEQLILTYGEETTAGSLVFSPR